MKKRDPYKLTAIIVLILTIIFFAYSITKYSSLENKITESVEARGLISVVIFSFILDLLPQYLSPHIFIFAHKLMGFDLFHLLLIVILGSSLGSLVGFEIGRKIKHKNDIFDFIGKKKIKLFENGINGWKKWIVSLAAISPLPYIPLILGMFKMSRKNFIIFGVIPRIIGFVMLSIMFLR